MFKLSAEVLRAAGGQVRCGKCGDIFNALAHLAEDPSAFTTGETEIDLEFRADSILESPAPMTPPQPPASTDEFAPPGSEIARLQILDWNEGDSTDDPGETSMEFTLPPGELDRIFVENKKKAPLPAPQAPTRAEPLPPHPEDAEVFYAAAPSGCEVSEDVRREMLSGMESPADAEAPLEAQRIAQPVRRRASPFAITPQAERSFMPWLIAAIASALLLIVQIVHQNRGWLAAHSPLGGTLRALYSTMGAPVPPLANLSAYQLRQWGVTGDPAGEGTLRVRASILNAAAQLEPFPLLRVTLANRFGSSIGTRDFEPSEYLGKPTARLLAPGERVDATMDILDPGKSAEGFEIDVCLRGSDRKISCANDAAPAQAKR
ncbi:MAG: DUF3426 domain-containing protein [Pseudomonadota bacterium]|nr:DUF3426 domain-containing protein [Pseudomonadota bacterium]